MKKLINILLLIMLATMTTECGLQSKNESHDADTAVIGTDSVPTPQVVSEQETADQLLHDGISKLKSSLPIDGGNGVSITDINIQGSYVMYTAECDEDIISIDLLSQNKEKAKQGIENLIVNGTDKSMAQFVKLCLKAHKGIGYIYVGDVSGDQCIVKIPYVELSRL